MARTLKELAREALQVQDACNLSGLVLGWARAVTELRACLPEADTEALNAHPVNQLWAAKLHDLARMAGAGAYARAYDACHSLAASPPERWVSNALPPPCN